MAFKLKVPSLQLSNLGKSSARTSHHGTYDKMDVIPVEQICLKDR